MIKNTIFRMSLAIVLVVMAGFVAFLSPSDMKNIITGKATSMVYIYETPKVNCSIYLKEGINMVTFSCDGGELSINQSLKNRTNSTLNYYAMFMYNPNNLNDSWSSYKEGLPNWTTQSIDKFDRRKGYAVVMNSPGTYYGDGYKFTNTVIPLYVGWNFIGYPTDVVQNMSTILSQIDGKYVRVEAYQNYTGNNYWRSYPNSTSEVLENFEPMIGYWVLMNDTGSLTINW